MIDAILPLSAKLVYDPCRRCGRVHTLHSECSPVEIVAAAIDRAAKPPTYDADLAEEFRRQREASDRNH